MWNQIDFFGMKKVIKLIKGRINGDVLIVYWWGIIFLLFETPVRIPVRTLQVFLKQKTKTKL